MTTVMSDRVNRGSIQHYRCFARLRDRSQYDQFRHEAALKLNSLTALLFSSQWHPHVIFPSSIKALS